MSASQGKYLRQTTAVWLAGTLLSSASAFAQEQAAEPGGIEEVVVTAQRREESAQKSSLALQVLSQQELERMGVGQPQDLSELVPGLQIAMAGAVPEIYIRGVGDLSGTAISNPAVAFNIDGVYVARGQSIEASMFDIERVEVLKGPQGTLYGRNASGGAINLLTNPPVLGELGGSASLEVGNDDAFRGEAAINLPVDDKLAVRGAMLIVSRDGYLNDGGNDDQDQSGRIEALFKPTDLLSILIAGDYGHTGGNGNSFALAPSLLGGLDPWTSTSSAAGRAIYQEMALRASLAGTGYPPPLLAPGSDALYHQDNGFWSLRGELDWDLGFATLTVEPAYRDTTLRVNALPADEMLLDGTFTKPETSQETTLEARLANNSDNLKWVAGLYFYNEDQYTENYVGNGLIQSLYVDANFNTRSYAGFGQATYSLSEDWRLIGGLRYTSDQRTASNGHEYWVGPGFSPFPFPASCVSVAIPGGYLVPAGAPECLREVYSGQKTYYATNWKAGVEHDLTPTSMAYFTWATGFKGGGFNEGLSPDAIPPATDASSYAPEKLAAYELGVRNRFFDNRLQINPELFYWQYDNHQEPHVVVDNLGVANFDIVNAGTARQYGADLDIAAKLTPDDLVRFTVEYLNTKYSSFSYDEPAAFVLPGFNGCGQVPSGMSGPAGPLLHFDCSGKQLSHAPRLSGTFGYEHRFDLPNGAVIQSNFDLQFASARWLATDFIAGERAPGYTVENLSVTYVSEDGRWTLMGFIRNISNEAVYTSAYENPFVAGYVGVMIGAPRTFGGRLAMSF